MNAQAVALFAEGGSDYVTDDVASILGRPARTFEQFVTDHATEFREAGAFEQPVELVEDVLNHRVQLVSDLRLALALAGAPGS
jgi:hypothetical protein